MTTRPAPEAPMPDTDLATRLNALVRRWRAELIGTADVKGGFNDGRALALGDCADDLEAVVAAEQARRAGNPQ